MTLKFNDPFFIVGCVRSGTTLLRLMLGHHPDICRCEEMEYITPALTDKIPSADSLQRYKNFLYDDRGFKLSNLTILESDDFTEIVNNFFQQIILIDNKKVYGAVVHNDFDRLIKLWPNSKYIYLVRDPRDVARSCVKMGWGGSPWYASNQWLKANHNWKILKNSLRDDQFIELSFESLILNPVSELSLICDFLGVQYHDSMLDIENDTTYSNVGANVAKSWKESASDYEVRQVETKIGPELQLAGYKVSGLPNIKNNLLFRTKIMFNSFYVRILFRIRRYGILLTFAEYLTRKIPIRSVRRIITSKLDSIVNSHMK